MLRQSGTGRTGTVKHSSHPQLDRVGFILTLCPNRLDIMHHAVGMMLDGNLQVVQLPKKLNRVLDIGTGTGIWAISMAE